MKGRFLFLVGSFLLVTTVRCGAQPRTQPQPRTAPGLGIEGVWQAEAATTRGNGDAKPVGIWTITPQRLTLATSSTIGATYSIRREQPLPEGSWTMDIWLLQTGNWSSPESAIMIGVPSTDGTPGDDASLRAEIDPDTQDTAVGVRMNGADGSLGDRSASGAGPVQWLRLTWDEANRSLRAAINGKPLRGTLSGKNPARTPVSISVTYPNREEGQRQFIVAGFRVRAGSGEKAASPLQVGAAWRGWSKATVQTNTLPGGWKNTLDRLSAPTESAPTRAFALSALLLLERSASDATWAKVSELVEKSNDLETSSLAQILPLAAAGAKTPAQREQVLRWSRLYFDTLTPDVRDGEAAQQLSRMALVDPRTSALELLKREVPYPLAEPLASDLKTVAPDLAFALWHANNGGSPLLHAAWHLPQWQELSPEYAALLVERVRALADEDGTFSHPDQVWSITAYRLSRVPSGENLSLALDFAEKIKDAPLRAQTLSVVTRTLDWPSATPRDALVEAALVRAVALVKANPAAGSEALQRVHLASFQRASGDTSKAATTLREVAASLATPPPAPKADEDGRNAPRFPEWFLLAREGERLALKDAASWWARAREEARQTDAIGRGAIVLDGDPGFSSAQWLNGFKADELSGAWNQYLAFVIERDPARGAKMWLQIEDETLRGDILKSFLGRRSLNRAAFRAFASALPADKPGVQELRDVLADANGLETDLARWIKATEAQGAGIKSDAFDDSFAARLNGLSPQQLLALEPVFGTQHALFARQMLLATAPLSGLSNDPLWQRMTSFSTRGGWSIPWGLALSSAVRENQENAPKDKHSNEIHRLFSSY